MTDHAPALELDHVSRRLGGRTVVRDVSLRVQRGEVLGLLGVNGAGKSTTMAMLAGALRPSRGRVRLAGQDIFEQPQAARSGIGWLPERAPLWPELTVAEHLDSIGRLRGLQASARREAAREVMQRLHLDTMARRLAGVLSQGQRQRLGLACALLHAPSLLVLDEPGNGLDPMQSNDLRALIRERAAAGCSVIVSTHLLPEVTAVCDRVAILHEGELRHDAPLRADAATVRVELAAAHDAADLEALPPVKSARALTARAFVVGLHDGRDSAQLARAVIDAGLPLQALQPGGGDLEHVFMQIAARSAQAA